MGRTSTTKACQVEDCHRAWFAGDYCQMHYARWKRHGDPLFVKRMHKRSFTDLEKFEAKVERTDGCWNWTGTISSNGYGRLGQVYAHRWSYEHHVGQVPEGLELDHLCRNRACVNPEHLEPVTTAENQDRGLNGVLKTECPHGHKYVESNIYWVTVNGYRCRRCRECQLKRVRERKSKR